MIDRKKDIYLKDMNDPCLTLEEWRKEINKLIRKYGKDCTLRTDGGYNNVQMILNTDTKNETS